MDYIEVTINLTPRMPWSDILIAELADLGFESFVETATGIQAYAPESIGNVAAILQQTSLATANEVTVEMTTAVIAHQNWNAQWEADFEPVIVDDRLAILAPFHDESAFQNQHKIIIQPQMSFGTGHHQTTFLMSQFLMDLDLSSCNIPSNIHALQWYETEGEIEFVDNPDRTKPMNEIINELPSWAHACVTIWEQIKNTPIKIPLDQPIATGLIDA